MRKIKRFGSGEIPREADLPSGGVTSLLRWNRRLGQVALFTLICGALNAQLPSGEQTDCTNTLFSNTAQCRGTTDTSVPANVQPAADMGVRGTDSQTLYRDQAGSDTRSRTQSSNQSYMLFERDPVTDFQRLVRTSTGEMLTIFGRDLFQHAPSTFAPADQIAATADYVIGPGDEVLVRVSGPEALNAQLTVDTSGAIYIPRVGEIHVAGLRNDQLEKTIRVAVNRVFRNYDLSVTLGHLRSIQVYVVGEARRPGAYTISALSTVLNALFVSGGPNVQGSLRSIQVRRQGQPAMELDLYDLVLRGDKSKDVRLQQGDTIFIPAAGPQVALGGSVRHPAIYELRGENTVAQLLAIAGGYTPTASRAQMSLERIDSNNVRSALSVATTPEGLGMQLRDGDVLFVNHISPGYEQSVTIRGNIANAGRFAWHPGMRLSEIIPDRMSLLTNGYWRQRNLLGVPEPLFEPDRTNEWARFGDQPGMQRNDLNRQGYNNQGGMRTQDSSIALPSSQLAQSPQDGSQPPGSSTGDQANQNGTVDTSLQPQSQMPQQPDMVQPQRVETESVRQRIQIPAPEIDWSYAVIERLDKKTLQNALLPFNLGRLVQDHDPTQDLELEAGDIVTILSQADIPVALDQQTKFVHLEGEVVSAGVYSVRPGETLRDVLRRAGGLTDRAYLYGSSFLRESARIFQQQRLSDYISQLSADMERSAAVRAASSDNGALDPNGLAEQRSLITQLRQMRATGRVVLEFVPDSRGADVVPALPLENGDVFRIPSRPNTVSVIGAVYGQNIFLYDHERRVQDYVALAGKPNRIADRSHSFIIRADGSIFSRERAQGIWSNGFSNVRINPGDAIVIPEKLIKPTAMRQLLQYSQILSSFGLAAAAINVVR